MHFSLSVPGRSGAESHFAGLLPTDAETAVPQATGRPAAPLAVHGPPGRLGPTDHAGQAGATTNRSQTQRCATLRTRICQKHLNGNVASSTFRETLTAVLLRPLSLHLAGPRHLDEPSNRAVSAWMRRHLRVSIVPYDDRDNLASLEHDVLSRLSPPLNLMGMPPTAVRAKLRELRRLLKAPT